MARHHKTELEAAKTKLVEMLAGLETLQTRIAKQKRVIAALTELADESDDTDSPTGLVYGITDACRTVLRAAEKPLFPIEVRDRVEKLGLPPQANLLASVHTVLKRLIVSGEGKEVRNPTGNGATVPAYEWNTGLKVPDLLVQRGPLVRAEHRKKK